MIARMKFCVTEHELIGWLVCSLISLCCFVYDVKFQIFVLIVSHCVQVYNFFLYLEHSQKCIIDNLLKLQKTDKRLLKVLHALSTCDV